MPNDSKTSFKVGDIVRLKSGGPEMTVSRIKIGQDAYDEDEVITFYHCTWFSGSKPMSQGFKGEILVEAFDDDES